MADEELPVVCAEPSGSNNHQSQSRRTRQQKHWPDRNNPRDQEPKFAKNIRGQTQSKSMNRELACGVRENFVLKSHRDQHAIKISFIRRNCRITTDVYDYNHSRRNQPIINTQHNRGNFRSQVRERGSTMQANYLDRKQESKPRFIGFKTLENLEKSDEGDIIVKLHATRDGFFKILGSPIEKNDVFVLVLKIVLKVCRSSFNELKLQILLDICNSQFIPSLLKFLMDLPYQENKQKNSLYWNDQVQFWKNFIVFCECIISLSPSTALNKCRSLVEAISKSCLEGLSQRHNFTLSEEDSNKITELRDKLSTFEMTYRVVNTEAAHGANVNNHVSKPPDDFRQLSLQPTISDFYDTKPFLRPNIVDGAYQDIEHYLDVQFRLMREDCFGPLRKGILQYKEDPNRYRFDNIRVHRNVRFTEPYISNTNLGSLVQIDINNRRNKNMKRTHWAHNKRFIFGCLVLFSADKFQSFIAATILDRDVNKLVEGKIPVSLFGEVFNDDLYNPDKTYTMIESEVYYEPYYHVMKVLQDPTFSEHVVMQEYIVKLTPEVKPPVYLTPRTTFSFSNTLRVLDTQESYEYSNLFNNEIDNVSTDSLTLDEENNEKNNPTLYYNVLQKDTWPSKEQLGFNESQYDAFHLALTNEFAVIQGPPGTGKTYLGVKIANTLLHSLNRNQGCLMLVICYTNHALDQFLEAILKTTKSVVRIGGQSKNEAMTNININVLRRLKDGGRPNNLFYDNKRIVKTALVEFRNALIRFEVLNNGIISCQCIVEEIQEVQYLWEFYRRSQQDPLHYWLFQHKGLYRTTLENILLEYETPNDETFEEIRKRAELILDDEDYNNEDSDKNEYLKASFSVNNSIATVRTLLKDYKRTNNLDLVNIIQDLDSQIKLYKDMEVYRIRPMKLKISRQTNFNSIKPAQRWALYFSWVKHKIDQIRTDIGHLEGSIKSKIEAFEESRMLNDLDIIKSKKVVGMTTTGAARLRKMLQTLKPPIVIVEEAAEVLEQHIVTSLTKGCKHLILIGDHQQLRPSASHVKLARHYNIEVSLFERMIKNGVHSRRLSVQHRMRPEIAALISPHIYPDLDNHPSVLTFPNVQGMKHNLYFFSHDYKEEDLDDNASRSNQKEADMTLALSNYLVQQGYCANEVTILAAYSGQAYYMKKQRQNYSYLNDVRITVVDNYQGEECKIILVTLVRNNPDNKIGFLGNENRICVALSRAKEGFYIFGNIDILKNNSKLWQNIATTLEHNESLGTSLRLTCQNHPETITTISTLEDFKMVPEGGCLKECNYELRCNHKCSLICHGYDREHKTNMTRCTTQCERILCKLGHVCPLKCFLKCNLCVVMVEKSLPCGHLKSIFCHLDPNDKSVVCYVELNITLPDCGHEAVKKCYESINSVQCKINCGYRVEKCGHACSLKCHVNNDADHELYVCRKACARVKKGCTAKVLGTGTQHHCRKQCYEACDDCDVKVTKKRSNCKHLELVACSQDPNITDCKKNCARSMPCGHFCKRKCFEECGNCQQMVTKIIPDCNHKVRLMCSKDATAENCESKCNKILSCGHPCQELCRQKCDPSKCSKLSTHLVDSPCDHTVALPCNISQAVNNGLLNKNVALKYCNEPCVQDLACEHRCSGTCARCYQGRIHVPCSQPCRRTNICGHECLEPCNQMCPPCNRRCEVECPHSRCNQLCGAPCVMCQEPCSRKCRHGACDRLCGQPCSIEPCNEPCELKLACGHRCRGLCGEPCPDICNECRPNTFPKGFIGEEFEEHDKFIQLQDCGHVLELENMDALMKTFKETIGLHGCPFCRKPIINTNRYKDLVLKTLKNDINSIKERVFGKTTEIAKKKKNLDIHVREFLKTYKSVIDSNLLYKKTFDRLLIFLKGKSKFSLLEVESFLIYFNIMDIIAPYYKKYKDESITNLNTQVELQIKIICNILVMNNKPFNTFKLSEQQQKDIGNEIKRLNLIIQLATIYNHSSYKQVAKLTKIKEEAEKSEAIIFSVYRFNESLAIKVLKTLEKEVAISGYVTKSERDLIVKAMGLTTGHWFKCPNGHIYAIGDCGGAMETSKCNECGVQIGGTSHRLLSSNSLAPEMDGARYPAWSELNNLANFRL